MHPRSNLLPLICALLVGCGADEPRPEQPSPFQEFDDAVEAYLQREGLAGATAVVVDRDEGIVHQRAYGSFQQDRISLIASASKVLSVGVVMRLADEGLIDLDEPIATYLDAWGQHKADITMAQLLSNSSGMVGLLDDPTYAPYICQFLDTGTLTECAEKIYAADDEADLVPPDTTFRYGGGQWQLAGGVAEVVSGKSWSELVEETYAACGLGSTGYSNHFLKASLEGGDTLAYPPFFSGDLEDLPVTDNPNVEGGAYSTIGDYARILLMHLRGGLCDDTRVLSEEAVLRMREDRILEAYGGSTMLDPTMEGYGLGWWVSRDAPLVSDAGAYGAVPWLDLERRYGAMFIIEGTAEQGVLLRIETQPTLEAILDARE